MDGVSLNASLNHGIMVNPMTAKLGLCQGVRVCVCVSTPVSRGTGFSLCSFHAGGMAAVSLAMPTKLWDSAGRECGRTFLYLRPKLFSTL